MCSLASGIRIPAQASVPYTARLDGDRVSLFVCRRFFFVEIIKFGGIVLVNTTIRHARRLPRSNIAGSKEIPLPILPALSQMHGNSYSTHTPSSLYTKSMQRVPGAVIASIGLCLSASSLLGFAVVGLLAD